MRTRRSNFAVLFARAGLLLALLVALVGALPAPWVKAQGAGPVVNTLVDEADGSCADGDCSLRDAIATAAAGETITFSVNGAIHLALGQLAVSKNLTISGPVRAQGIVVDGHGASRVFSVTAGAVVISYLNITGGTSVDGLGGGIFVGPGATLSLNNSAVFANLGNTEGGAVYIQGATATVTNSTISDNGAASGAGIYNATGGTLAVVNSTIIANTATVNGGGIQNSAVYTLRNSVVAGNSALSGPDCGNVPGNSNGYNILGANCAGFAVDTDAVTDTPLLGALQYNGGPTRSRAPLLNSEAVNFIPGPACNGGPAVDQRGYARPATSSVLERSRACDAGAVELQYISAASPSPEERAANRSITITATYPGPVNAATVTRTTFAVHGFQGGRPQIGYTAAGSQVTFTPSKAFFAGELVQASATSKVLDAGGGAILTYPMVWQFTTATAPGGGSFMAHPVSPTLPTQYATEVKLGDIDGDGDLDAVFSRNGTTGPLPWVVYKNDGQGNFILSNTYGSGRGTGIDLLDADGDGDLDVLVTNKVTPFAEEIWRNDGVGNFGSLPFSTFNGGNETDSTDSAVGDLNGDGYLDVVVADETSPREVYVNDGAGNLSIQSYFGDNYSNNSAVALADLDRDGDLDAVAAINETIDAHPVYMQVFLNDGVGNFAVHPVFPNVSTGGAAADVRLGDLNGDGYPDLVVANSTGAQVWINDHSGAFPGTASQTLSAGDVRGASLGDLNGDGSLDLVLASVSGDETVWTNNGAGVFTQRQALASGSNTVSVAMGDLNGDGRLDLVFADEGVEAQTVFMNNTLPTVSAIPMYGFEDVTMNFTAKDFNDHFTDADQDSLTKIRVTTVPAAEAGTLRLNNTPVQANQEIPAAQLANLNFVPVHNWNGNATFTFRAADGLAYSTAGAVVTLHIEPVDDAPVWSAGLDDVIIPEERLFTLALPGFVSDIDTAASGLSYSFSSTPTSSGMAINLTTHAFTWTSSFDEGPGDYYVTFTVTDGTTPVSKLIRISVSEATVYLPFVRR